MSHKSNRRMATFVREFSFLPKLPRFDYVSKIRVERGSPGLLEETGQETQYAMGGNGPFDSYTKFYAVTGESIVELKSAGVYSCMCSGFASDRYTPDKTWQAERNGVQLHKLGLKPDFIVRRVQDGSGNAGDVLTIYKMDRFDYEGYYKDVEERMSQQEQADMEHLMSTSVHPERQQRLLDNLATERLANHVERQDALREGYDRRMDNEFSDFWE